MANALQLTGGSVLKDLESHTKERKVIRITDIAKKESNMADKVQKIKEWISKEQNGLMDAQGNFEYPEHEGAYNILCNLGAYIDTLQEEPVSDELEKAAEQDVCEVVNTCSATGIPNDHIPSWVQDAMINEFIHGAKWQFERVKEALLSEVLPCFMHGGEADEVVAKLDEVLNFQKK